jgi:hypothetical protein
MEDIDLIKSQMILFNDFLKRKFGFLDDFFDIKLLDQAYQEKNMKVIKSANNEILVFTKQMPLLMQLELRDLFIDKTGVNIEVLQKLFDNKIDKLIKKSKIDNNDEYLLLIEKMDDLTDFKTEEEVEKINTMLINYYNKNN